MEQDVPMRKLELVDVVEATSTVSSGWTRVVGEVGEWFSLLTPVDVSDGLDPPLRLPPLHEAILLGPAVDTSRHRTPTPYRSS